MSKAATTADGRIVSSRVDHDSRGRKNDKKLVNRNITLRT